MRRSGFGRWGGAVLLPVALMASLPARAEDGGFFGFLASLGGGTPRPAPVEAPPASAGEQVRPLTVRRSPKKARAGFGRARVARVPTKTGPVSIFEDPTLRNGDAVMTKDGMRVFAGGRFSPDRPFEATDFVAVSAAKTVSPNVRKTVIELNRLPHG